MEYYRPATPSECAELEQVLGDTPATLIPLHQLRTGQAIALIAGNIFAPDAVVIQANDEPTAFGTSGRAVWDLLSGPFAEHWTCVELSLELGDALGDVMHFVVFERYHDLYYTLERPLLSPPKPRIEVRLLTTADIPVWQAASPELNKLGFTSHHALLAAGFAAGAFEHGELVALAHTSALSAAYADVGVYTSPAYRGLGLATYAAALVMAAVVTTGRIPVWSTGEDNFASQRVALKLGMRPIMQRVYIIPILT